MTPALTLATLIAEKAIEWQVSQAEARRRLMAMKMDLADAEWEKMMEDVRKKEAEEQKLRTAGNEDPQVLLNQDGSNAGTVHSGSAPPTTNPTVAHPRRALGKVPSSQTESDLAAEEEAKQQAARTAKPKA